MYAAHCPSRAANTLQVMESRRALLRWKTVCRRRQQRRTKMRTSVALLVPLALLARLSLCWASASLSIYSTRAASLPPLHDTVRCSLSHSSALASRLLLTLRRRAQDTAAGAMSGLRDLVSGAGCSADGGGPSGAASNPAASFADALLGGSSKGRNGQLRELPGARRLAARACSAPTLVPARRRPGSAGERERA